MPIPTTLWRPERIQDEYGNFKSWIPLEFKLVKQVGIKCVEVCLKTSIESWVIHLDDFFETEEDCWDAINLDLASEIMDKESEIESLQRELQALKDYQSSLP